MPIFPPAGSPDGRSSAPTPFAVASTCCKDYLRSQGLSTSGALLLLALHGPGQLAVEEDEQLLVGVSYSSRTIAAIAAVVIAQ